jgi:hypothetical protein
MNIFGHSVFFTVFICCKHMVVKSHTFHKDLTPGSFPPLFRGTDKQLTVNVWKYVVRNDVLFCLHCHHLTYVHLTL